MRNTPNVKANKYRVREGVYASDDTNGNAGAFMVPCGAAMLVCIVSDAAGWDHASVHIMYEPRTPTWEEMCFVKDLFFKDDEVVMQLHPGKADYINSHATTLHLWRPQTAVEAAALTAVYGVDPYCHAEPGPIPLPPKVMV